MFTQTVARALSRRVLDQRGTDPHPRQPAPMLLLQGVMKMVVITNKKISVCNNRRRPMRIFLTALICCGVLLAAWPIAACAQPAVIIISPNVTNPHPYTAETRYMSLVGYYRTLVHTQTGVWMTYEAAEHLVKQLGGH
jgi:hypothetical protein